LQLDPGHVDRALVMRDHHRHEVAVGVPRGFHFHGLHHPIVRSRECLVGRAAAARIHLHPVMGRGLRNGGGHGCQECENTDRHGSVHVIDPLGAVEA
jgi:hypothetical protein